MTSSDHVPVLAEDLVRLADVGPGDTVVDGTFGAGGHSTLLARQMDGRGTIHAVDRDPTTERFMAAFAEEFPGIELVRHHETFPDAFQQLVESGASADVVILDVGVSSMQIDTPERGFSYRFDAPLDMRMDQRRGMTAAQLLATAGHDEITRIIREYGEDPEARRIATAIVRTRDDAPIETTGQLSALVHGAVSGRARRRRGDPAKRTFQALRIAVNAELDMLDRGLDAALSVLADGGRLIVISFHSLEDRIVKRRMRDWANDCTCPPRLPVCGCDTVAEGVMLTRKGVQASEDEASKNVRATSARLRAFRRSTTSGGQKA